MFGFELGGLLGKREELGSVGVGGVLMIVGAALALVDGGVTGRSSVSSIKGTFGFGLSNEVWLSFPCAARSGNIAPNLADTLPLRFTISVSLAMCLMLGSFAFAPVSITVGVTFRLELKASLILLTGDSGLLLVSSAGACRDAVMETGALLAPELVGRTGCEAAVWAISEALSGV